MKGLNVWKILLIVILFGFLFLINYSPHFSYRFPIHQDEYTLLSAFTNLKNLGGQMFEYVLISPIEKGFALVLLFLDLFFDVVHYYKFLPSLNLLLVGGILFYFMNKKFGFWTGLFSVLFLGSLRSNVNILGFWFFVPIMFGFFLVYLFLFRLDGLKERSLLRDYLVLALLLGLLGFVHQSSFLVIFLVFILWNIFNYSFFKENYKKFLLFLIILIPIFVYITSVLRWFDFRRLAGNFIWGSGIFQINYNPFLLFGLVSSLFLIWGYYLCFKKKELLVFRIYVLIPLISILFFWIFGLSIFSSYQRYLYHFMIASVPLAGIGFYDVMKRVFDFIKKYSRNLACVVVILLILVSFTIVYWNYFHIDENVKLYRLIDEQDYEAMIFLRDFGENKPYLLRRRAQVISPVFPGGAMHVYSDKVGYAGLNDFSGERNKITNEFFSSKCDVKKGIILDLNDINHLEYVYSYEAIDCDFLDKIFQNEGVWIYEIKLD